MEPYEALEEAAAAILDGSPVDWDLLDSHARAIDRRLVAQLRLLGTVRTIARGGEQRGGSLEYWGHLRLLERIGRGAFGEVHRAWDTRLDREVALKLLPLEAVPSDSRTSSLIIEEGRLLARVRHPNVVTIYGAERLGGRIGLWMEFVKGRTLEAMLHQGAAFTPAEVSALAGQLCSAVSAVHGAGLIHRDIKAQNVMVADDGRLVLMDFGTGRDLADGPGGGISGTPLYLAPEVLAGANATVQSDIYSIGVLLYHLLTNSYPIQAPDLRALRRAHAAGERIGLRSRRPDVTAGLAGVIERAINPDPERRYRSAASLAADLTPEAARRSGKRYVYATAAAAAILAAAAWGGGELRDRGLLPRSLSGALVATGVVPAVDSPVIAVLPFKNLSSEPDSDYFVDGLTDEIIRNLAVIDGLQVRSQTSSFFFKGKPRSVRDVGEQLGVNLVLDGSVQRDGRRLRITAQLIQVAGDVPLWADRFDRPLEDIFAVQDEISRAIVNELRLALGRGQRRYQTDVDTYELYLRGRQLIDRRGTQSAQQAAALFEQVIAKDPAFAPAHAGLADAYAFMSLEIRESALAFEEGKARMRMAAMRALELDPLLAEAHAAMGLTLARERRWSEAQKAFRRAIELNPSLTQTYTNYANSTLFPLNELQEAEQLLTRAREADPLSLAVRFEMALLQIIAGRYEDAIANLQHVRAADQDFTFADLLLARALTLSGRLAEAWPIWNARQGAGWEFWSAHAMVISGQRERAEQMAARHPHPFRQALIYTALGDNDRAFDALNRAIDLVPHRVALVLVYPEMASLRRDPRFSALRKRLNLP